MTWQPGWEYHLPTGWERLPFRSTPRDRQGGTSPSEDAFET